MGGLGPGIGGFELVVIAIVALIVVGPKDLPVLMRRVGKMMGKARAMANEFRSSFDEMARQSELDELRKEVESLRSGQGVYRLGDEAEAAFKDIRSDLNKPLPATTPAAAALAAPALSDQPAAAPAEWPDPEAGALAAPSPEPASPGSASSEPASHKPAFKAATGAKKASSTGSSSSSKVSSPKMSAAKAPVRKSAALRTKAATKTDAAKARPRPKTTRTKKVDL